MSTPPMNQLHAASHQETHSSTTPSDQPEIQEKQPGDTHPGAAEKDESPRGKNSRALIWFLLFIIIFAVGIYYVSTEDSALPSQDTSYDATDLLLTRNRATRYTYNDFEFEFKNGLWTTSIHNLKTGESVKVDLHYGPRDLQRVPRSQGMLRFFEYLQGFRGPQNRSGATYVVYAPNETGIMGVAFLEAYNNLQQGLNIQALTAFSNNNTARTDIPIKSCDTTEEPIIWLRHESPTQILYQEPNCLIVQGEGKELWKAENLMLYIFYGIIPN